MLPRSLSETSISRHILILPLVLLLATGCTLDTAERLDRARAAFEAGDFRAAVIDTKSVLQEEPENVDARLLLARSSLREGDVATAEASFARAISLGISAGDVAVEYGQALLATQKFEELLEQITVSMASDDDTRVEILLLRADSQMALGLFGTARSVYEEALSIDAARVEARVGLAATYAAQQDFDVARERLDDALQSNPDNISVRLASGNLWLAVKQYDAALNDFRAAAQFAVNRNFVPLSHSFRRIPVRVNCPLFLLFLT